MNKILTFLIGMLMFCSLSKAQNSIDNVLVEIEKNNTTIQALRQNADADIIGNKVGILPQNPEVEFGYLWGSPTDIGNRTDISITQSFDFPTAYSYRNQIANARNSQTELNFQVQRKELLYKARLDCIDLIYQNAIKNELNIRLDYAQRVANAYKQKLDLGETSALDYNKALLNLLNVTKQMESVEIVRNSLLSHLAAMNGGIPINFSDSVFSQIDILTDFEQWYAQAEQANPNLVLIKQGVDISQKQIKLNRSLSLPRLQAGYMSEKVVGEHFQGITVGLSIPLWENKNAVKYAQSKLLAVQAYEVDSKIQYYNHLKSLYNNVSSLQASLNDYKIRFKTINSSEMLAKALEKGEISLVDYMLEFSMYFDTIEQILTMEKDLNRAIAEMNQYL